MTKGNVFKKIISYVLVAAVSSVITFGAILYIGYQNRTKLDELNSLIDNYYIGEPNRGAMEEAAAFAMIDAMGDKWSYYIPARDYAAYMDEMNNAYVGIGVTVTLTEDETGMKVNTVEEGGSAKEVGIRPGDVIIAVEGELIADLGMQAATARIKGEENTTVTLTVHRGEEELDFTPTRRTIEVIVAAGQMLPDNIGLVTINNFDARCAEETIAAIEALVEQGAQALIFDVRYNPGGYKHELVKVLDYLLPEGVLFHSEDYTGAEAFDYSDKACLELPMAVLVNAQSYSAAEFFAAALEEYDWAFTAGANTTGKGYFQSTFQMSDGSAVGLSIGKYFTPNGVSLAEVGGLQVKIPVATTEEMDALIYGGLLPAEEDPQIQAAVKALMEENP